MVLESHGGNNSKTTASRTIDSKPAGSLKAHEQQIFPRRSSLSQSSLSSAMQPTNQFEKSKKRWDNQGHSPPLHPPPTLPRRPPQPLEASPPRREGAIKYVSARGWQSGQSKVMTSHVVGRGMPPVVATLAPAHPVVYYHRSDAPIEEHDIRAQPTLGRTRRPHHRPPPPPHHHQEQVHRQGHWTWQTRPDGRPHHLEIRHDHRHCPSARFPSPRTLPQPVPRTYAAHQKVFLHPLQQERSPIRPEVPVTVSSEESGGTPPSATTLTTSVHHDHYCPPFKRSMAHSPPQPQLAAKRPKGIDKLDLLVEATLEIGPLAENPSGCSCPKSKCIALYCECFKAGRRCDPGTCSCVDCKNTINESGPDGARTKAIRCILARNPRAFQQQNKPQPTKEGEIGCNCMRSRCLKLYCTCFQVGRLCKEDLCTCLGCLNLDARHPERQLAIQQTLQKRPDAFDVKPKVVGLGCACKNNRCIRKYCECFRLNQTCTEKCSCVKCLNQGQQSKSLKSNPPCAEETIVSVSV